MQRGLILVSLAGLCCLNVAVARADSWQVQIAEGQQQVWRLIPVAMVEPEQDSQAMAWLKAMSDAMRTTDYSGTYVHVRGDEIDTTALWHRAGSAGEQEKLLTLSGESRVVLRQNDHCECQWPDRREIVFGDFPGVRSRLSGLRFSDPQALTAHYRIVSLGTSRVADHACHVVGLVPKDAWRYGYKLCITAHSHLLARMSLYDTRGLPIEHDFFTALNIGATDGQSWPDMAPGKPDAVPPGYRIVERPAGVTPQALAPDEGWSVSPLLPGYQIKSRVWRENPVTHQRFEHIIVSDGLSTASVFVEHLPQTKALDPDAAKYGVNIVVRQVGDVRLTVIGDVPMAAVEQICQNTRPVQELPGAQSEQNPLLPPGAPDSAP
ncbi:MucB/RseB C-terminal domain-containing protein [Halothiobacillus sp. DCM-1]|uniref:MucB/RseB C-terminal domain-containing protein n=1 Tax=Halothiobacillus sp. DCM-1 TaxID=3112558 RepID=UPI00325117C5